MTPTVVLGRAADALAIALAALAIWTAGRGVFDNAWYSGLTVALGVAVVLLPGGRTDAVPSPLGTAARAALALAFAGLIAVWLRVMLAQEMFFVDITRAQHLMAWAAFALLAFVTWRAFGPPMALVMGAAAAWAALPFGADESWTRMAESLWYSTDGVFGRPVEVVGRIVLVYIAFGAVLQASGAGAVLLRLAFVATARMAGGPAHAAIVGSALFGTLSGAAVANVVSTGVFTIPVIKRAGFSPRFAGGVEAAASTGGQITPPVMGVVAFLMADLTGQPYLTVVLAATIPAALFYAALFLAVRVEARRLGVRATPPSEREPATRGDALRSLAFVAPLGVIVWLLVEGRTAQYAGFYALLTAFALCLALFPGFRHPRAWLAALVEAGRASAALMVVVAAVGFVVGVVNMTGVGLTLAQGILALSGASLTLSLVLVALGCLVLGMGVPSAPAYLVVAVVMGPALERLGVPTLAAHLFMLYFAVLSVVTPPVALAAFAAAPIAGAGPMKTGWAALRLAAPGFAIPFAFVAHPDMLLTDGVAPLGLAWGVGAFALAAWCIATALGRFDARRLAAWEAAARIGAAAAVLAPVPAVSAAGGAAALGLIALHHAGSVRRQEETP